MYIVEMFADPSDRARFLAIILSAFFVGVGVWYTQRQITKRESTAFRVSKIEELYKITNDCIHLIENMQEIGAQEQRHLDSVMAGMNVKKAGLVYSEVKDDLLKKHKHLEMLINLYFPRYSYTSYLKKYVSTDELAASVTIEQALKDVQIANNSSSVPDVSLDALDQEAEYYIDLTIELSKINDK
ncbi:hypothetical protein Sps_02392 [Shewanella psychrophila]|uniref:DUF2489 domain-containing protein n=1 Tax=Shewanella psychrophila TaxID=225848 RepID=A0A1S6HPT8_9GAMM|nr:hypothetical protein [Shewanella psychrophila]AQS37546.1 hypothetical protein Sps_02392 [Shewanella psychrophila]